MGDNKGMNKSERAYDLIAFDWDGTLHDSTAAITLAIQRSVGDLGYPVPSRDRASYVIGLGLQEALAYAAPDVPESRYIELGQRYRHHFSQAIGELTLFEGVLPLLHDLKAAGFKLAVATGKSRAGLNEVLSGLDVAGLFDDSRTADETAGKPNPQMLFELMASCAVSPDRVLMVGDTSHDLLMANRAGCSALGVTYGAHDAAALEACHPRHVVGDVPALRDWLLAS